MRLCGLFRFFSGCTVFLSACSLMLPTQASANNQSYFIQNYSHVSNLKSEHVPVIYNAEQYASPAGKAVLRQARVMSLDQRKVVKGSCWDYLNAVFKKAGVKRNTIFKGDLRKGPYINVNNIQAGDWLYYVNHSYHDIEHSGMFVGWVNKGTKEALILSYAGGNRNEPARYKVYDISHVYNVMRPSFDSARPSNGSYLANSSNKRKNNSVSTQFHQLNRPVQPDPRFIQSVPNNQNQFNQPYQNQSSAEAQFVQRYANENTIKQHHLPLVYRSEQQGSAGGLKVLRQARQMTLDNQDIVAGTSSNYIDVLFRRAGVRRETTFKSYYPQGPFINPQSIRAGDWLSFVNHGYNGVEHDGIFVGWVNKSNNQALILSYGGENRPHPARYRVYDVSNVYQVTRPH